MEEKTILKILTFPFVLGSVIVSLPIIVFGLLVMTAWEVWLDLKNRKYLVVTFCPCGKRFFLPKEVYLAELNCPCGIRFKVNYGASFPI